MMIVWKQTGSHFVGTYRGNVVITLAPTPEGWRWALSIAFVDAMLLHNPFAPAPRLQGQVRGGDAEEAKYMAAMAVVALAA